MGDNTIKFLGDDEEDELKELIKILEDSNYRDNLLSKYRTIDPCKIEQVEKKAQKILDMTLTKEQSARLRNLFNQEKVRFPHGKDAFNILGCAKCVYGYYVKSVGSYQCKLFRPFFRNRIAYWKKKCAFKNPPSKSNEAHPLKQIKLRKRTI